MTIWRNKIIYNNINMIKDNFKQRLLNLTMKIIFKDVFQDQINNIYKVWINVK